MAERALLLAKAVSLLVAAVGLTVVAAWVFHVPALTAIANGPNIKANTGVCLAAIGLAILVVLFRNRATINVDELDALKG